MNEQSYRELAVLEELSTNPSVTQRHLASRLEVALGLANLMLKRVVKKGYVKVVSVQKNRLRYLLTPTGLAEKTRLTYEYLEYSLHLHRTVRRLLTETLAKAAAAGTKRIVFFGVSEIAEIAYLTIKELGLELVAVVDEQQAGLPAPSATGQAGARTFLGLPVMRLQDALQVPFDCGIVSALNGDLEALRRQLLAMGVPVEKLIVLEHHGPRVRVVAR